MLKKILFQTQERKQFWVAMTGSVLGLTFLVSSIHYLIRVNEFGEGTEILGPNTVIVQKKISTSTTLNLTKNDFSIDEINAIKNTDFISKVEPVITNSYDVSFETDDPMVPRFKTDVFVQSVDSSLLDVKTNNWNWKPGDTFLPIVLPREFLVMLNTFMSASGIPQVSDELVMDVKFKFRLSNNNLKEYVPARIVGFTNEVSALLVPQSFMDWANNRYAPGVKQKVTQLMLQSKEGRFGEVEQFMKEHFLETKNAQMIVGKLKSMVSTLIGIIVIISIIAVILSVLVFVQYVQLLISKNNYELRTLLRIGYSHKSIVTTLSTYFYTLFAKIITISLLLFMVVKYFVDSIFNRGGIFLENSISLVSIVALMLAYIIFAWAAHNSSKKGVLNANKG